MIWQIAFKEIYHNLTTLRFALIIIILPVLFVANSLIYSLGGSGYTARVNTYNQQIAQNRDHIENLANKGLAELALIGPGEISKRPNLLTFCADGADKLVPRSVTMQNVGMLSRAGFDEFVEGYQWIPPWILEYPLENKGGNMIQRIKIDWVFIGILMSFFVILFTFDAIAGERARGTLSLMMSNAVSRGQMLLGKYLGAFVTVFLPLIISILINLLVIHFFGNIPFASEHWLRILGMVGLFALLVSIFIFLGLFSPVVSQTPLQVWYGSCSLGCFWRLSFRAYSGLLSAI